MGTNRRTQNLLAAAGAIAVTAAGCGHAAGVSTQLTGARAVLNEARQSAASRVEPDELLVAERTLDVAENAPDGSMAEMHYAYLAERQARVAMADARRRLMEQGIAQDESEYHAELERVARERGVALDTTRADLAEQQRILDEERRLAEQQAATLRERDRQLAVERQARQQAEENARRAMERVAQLATVRQGPAETVITLSGQVLFETGSADLKPEARERLSAVAAALRATPEQSAIVAGYTDSRGAHDRNRELSQRRAEAVREYLVSQGVPNDRIRAEGRGDTMPIANNGSPEGRATNRRVEIIITPVSTGHSSPTAPMDLPSPTPQSIQTDVPPNAEPMPAPPRDDSMPQMTPRTDTTPSTPQPVPMPRTQEHEHPPDITPPHTAPPSTAPPTTMPRTEPTPPAPPPPMVP